MFNTIKKYFEQHISPAIQDDTEHKLKLATAALLIEMIRQDDHVYDVEIQAVKNSLKEEFDLNDDETDELFDLAYRETKNAADYYQFTNLIARQFSQPQKIKVIEYLWVIAYADNNLDSYEEHMVRRIADLIYVSHKDFMKAKHKVLERAK